MNADPLPLQALLPPLLLSVTAVTALVLCDFRGLRPGRYLCKPLAAVAFIWLALNLGALDSDYGRWLLGALVLCMAGDLFLMADSERWFLAGLVAFLCGHLLFGVTFLQLPVNTTGVMWSVLPAVVLLVGVGLWLRPHVGADMQVPVALYVLVISAMLLCAGATIGQPAAGFILCGAWGFAASDLAVARRQFVDPTPWNGLWGTPLYFGSQMLLAASAALVN